MLNAIAVRPPWAFCFTDLRPGSSTPMLTLNRGGKANWRGIVALYAGAEWDEAGLSDWRVQRHLVGLTSVHPDVVRLVTQDQPTGAVTAVAELVDCHLAEAGSVDDQPGEACCWPWGDRLYKGRPAWHYALGDVRVLRRPVRCGGQVRIGWELPADVEARVLSQINQPTKSRS